MSHNMTSAMVYYCIWATVWQNQQNGMCTQQRLRSALASAQSDQSFRCLHAESLGPLLPIEHTAKTLIRLGGCPGWSESSLGTQSLCWFCHVAAHLLRCTPEDNWNNFWSLNNLQFSNILLIELCVHIFQSSPQQNYRCRPLAMVYYCISWDVHIFLYHSTTFSIITLWST